jgi:hypothetical protein
MPKVKDNWVDTENYYASDANEVAHQVNENIDVIAGLVADMETKAPLGHVHSAPYDLTMRLFLDDDLRVPGYSEYNKIGVRIGRAVTFTSVTFRGATAGGVGDLVCELRKNGVTVAGSSTAIPPAEQVTGKTTTGSWAFAAGDILTAYTTAVSSPSGKGLVADIVGETA